MPLLVTIRPFDDAQLVDQCVGIDVIESVAGRNIGRLSLEDGGQVGVFAVEVDQVGAEVALLEHVAGARQVIDPWRGLVCPGFVAIEPLAERARVSVPGAFPTSG